MPNTPLPTMHPEINGEEQMLIVGALELVIEKAKEEFVKWGGSSAASRANAQKMIDDCTALREKILNTVDDPT